MAIDRLWKIAAVYSFLFILGCFPASSRVWKPSPEKLAQEYALISDHRAAGEFILLQWFAPTLINQRRADLASFTQMLRQYIVVMVVHARLDEATGSFSFDEIPTLQATDQQNKALPPVSRESLPPTMVGALTGIESMFRQSVGNLGKGMKLFVFDSQGLDSCKKGRLSIPIADEIYTWDTPLPGCPQR